MAQIESTRLYDKVLGCLYGGAVGDAMGAPAEGYMPADIQARYGYITDFVEGWDSDIGKGDLRRHGAAAWPLLRKNEKMEKATGVTPTTPTWCSCLAAATLKKTIISMPIPLPGALYR